MKINNLSIGKKISLGFLVVILITIAYATYCNFNFADIKNSVLDIKGEYMEEIKYMTEAEENYLTMRIYLKAFVESENYDYLDTAYPYFNSIAKSIDSAVILAKNSRNLKAFTVQLEDMQKSVQDYKSLVDKVKEEYKTKDSYSLSMDQSIDEFRKTYYLFLNGQNTKLKSEFTNTRYTVVSLLNEIALDFNKIIINRYQYHLTKDSAYIVEINNFFDEIESDMTDLDKLCTDTIDKENCNNLNTALNSFKDNINLFVDSEKTILSTLSGTVELGEKITAGIKDLNTNGVEATIGVADTTFITAQKSVTILIIVTVLLILLGIVISILLIKNITNSLNSINQTLSYSAGSIESAATQLSSSSQQLASGGAEQASSIEEISATMEETSSLTAKNADNAKEASNLSTATSSLSKNGSEQMNGMVKYMEEIKQSSDEISKVIKVIDEIAFQTNILALNAAVEAARAGDAGMGFAVVAEEVRNLAQRSAVAAKDTAQMIEKNIKLSQQGVEMSKTVNSTLSDINKQTDNVTQLVAEVASASEEQTRGIEQVTTAITQMDSVVQENASSAEETSSAAQELSNQAFELTRVVGELNKLVKGSKGLTSDSHHIQNINYINKKNEYKPTAISSKTALQSSSNKKINTNVKKPVSIECSPEDIIPLEKDNDF